MSTPKHTPAPWIVANGLQVWKDGSSAATSPRICTLKNAASPVEHLSDAEMEANAQLIAAAPELLQLLETVSKRLELEEKTTPGGVYLLAAYRLQIAAAIRKATGGAS